MYFHRVAALALTASLALVDARAITKSASQHNGGIAERGNNAIADDLKPRWTNKVTGEKLSVRALSGLGDDIQVSKPGFEANAKACSESLEKLRKLRRKRAARAERKVRRRRAQSESDDEEMEDEEEGEEEGEEEIEDDETDTGDDMELDSDDLEGQDLGPNSYTDGIGEGEFFPYDKIKDVSVLGTMGLNSCSGVLIVGEKGAIIAHLMPISPQEGLTEAMFQKSVDVNVTGLYTKNKANLAGAKMYTAVPNEDDGEKVILKEAAKSLGIELDPTGYDRVDDDVFDDEDYLETGIGTIYVNFKDTNNLKVKVFGKDKQAPSPPAAGEDEEMQEGSEEMQISSEEMQEGSEEMQEGSEEMQESSEEGESVEPEGSEEEETVEDTMQQ
ncbi:MAG: hypothetical protein Q9180_006744 [Flavoplaca navasiana]